MQQVFLSNSLLGVDVCSKLTGTLSEFGQRHGIVK